jgi:hypothetical protein
MSFAPLHYRKLRIAEHGAFALLPLYVRCFGEGLKKLCDDRGRIVLDGRAPADVIARRGGAETNERRRIAGDINELIRVGWLREEDDALVVVEQEQDWEQLDSSRALNMRPSSSRRGSERHPTRFQLASDLRPACSQSESSARNHSADHAALIRSTRSDQQEERRSSPIGEGVQGEQVSETDPTPTLRKQQLDEAIGKGPADWGMEGSGQAHDDPAKAQTPTPRPAPPSPPAPRPEPFVAVVDPKPVPNPDPPALALTPSPQAAKSPKGKVKPKSAALPPEQRVIALSPAEQAAVSAIRNDPDLARICKNVEQLAVDLVNCAPLVDVALEIRGLGAYLRTDKGRAKRYTDGNGYLLNNIGRKQNEQRERQASMPQYVAPPPEPKRPVPPPPPPHPMVQAAIDRRMASDEPIDLLSLCKRVGNPFRDLDESQVAL